MNFKRVIAAILVLMLFFTFFACNKDKGKETAKDTPIETTEGNIKDKNDFDLNPQRDVIKAWLWNNDPEDAVATQFSADYPDYTLDNSVANTNPFGNPDKSVDLPRLAGTVASNEQPDLYIGYMTPTEAFYSGLFISLQDHLTYDPDFNFDSIESNAFIDVTFNGEVYFLPYAYSVPVLLWNKDLFEDVGLDPEKPPKTWAELKDYCEKLVKYDSSGKLVSIGLSPINHPVHLRYWQISAFGEHTTDRTGFSFDFNTPKSLEFFEFIKWIPQPYGGMKMHSSSFDFLSGTAAMGTWNADGLPLVSSWASFEFGIGQIPRADDSEDNNVPICTDNLIGILRNANNINGGWLLGKYLMTEAKYAESLNWYESNPNYCMLTYIAHKPTREKLYDYFDDVLTEKSWNNIRTRDELMNKGSIPMYGIVVQSQFDNYFTPEINKMLNDQIAPQDLLINAESFGKSIISDFRNRKEAERWKFNDDGTVEFPSEP